MAHINSIGAGIYSRVLVAVSEFAGTFDADTDYKGNFASLAANRNDPDNAITVAANAFLPIPEMREAPSFGVPPSLVNVPNFGSATSKQVQGQADPTNIELAINYVPRQWIKNELGAFVNDGKDHLMAVVLMNSAPETSDFVLTSASIGSGVQNSIVYFVGSLAAIQFQPNLADSNQGTVTIALKSEFGELHTV